MRISFLIICFGILFKGPASSHPNRADSISEGKVAVNFFVVSKPKKLFDPGTFFNIARAKRNQALHGGKFICIVASSTEQMVSKMEAMLRRKNAVINSLWFDSHGHYNKGYSLFEIGRDEFSHKNINDTGNKKMFAVLTSYCTASTKIGIGSCYGGATYSRPASNSFTHSRMNGDSLMIGLANVFYGATIYACESWVMTKPGLFKEKFAMAGYPLRRKFRDVVFDPVWDRFGKWNSYNSGSGQFQPVNCIILTKHGEIKIRFNDYQSLQKVKKQIDKNKKRLKENLLRA